jgi:hypothetical protein
MPLVTTNLSEPGTSGFVAALVNAPLHDVVKQQLRGGDITLLPLRYNVAQTDQATIS